MKRKAGGNDIGKGCAVRGAGPRKPAARGKGRLFGIRGAWPRIGLGAALFFCAVVLLSGCVRMERPSGAETLAVTQPPLEETEGTGTLPAEPEPPETEAQSGISGEGAQLLTEEQKAAICAYMDRFYQVSGTLEMAGIGDLFVSSAAAQLAFHQHTWEYLIGIRSMQETDLRLADYFYDMRVLGVEKLKDGGVSVDLSERSVLYFAQTPETASEYPGIRHNFVLARENGTWKIREHIQWDGVFWNMINGHQDQDLEELEDADAAFAARKELLLEQAAEARKQWRAGGDVAAGIGGASVPDHPYDVEAAIAYARRYTGQRSGEWHDYSAEGGNCQNFVSQCLIAGGIPMDTEGEARWKWYGAGVNNSADELGCTMSWINVDSFYEYARDNEGFGLAAETDAGLENGRPGDLIVMGRPGDWNHIVIITEVVKNDAGETIDHLICSNTSEVKDFPASAYPLPRRALIRVLGWNGREEP